jgi:hypothetical protein
MGNDVRKMTTAASRIAKRALVKPKVIASEAPMAKSTG